MSTQPAKSSSLALERKAEEYLTLSSNSEDLLKGTIALTDVDAMLDFDIATKMLPRSVWNW